MADDWYAVLGISPDASPEQIRAAYRQAARRSHPDLGGNSARFRSVKEAWDVLGDPDRRAAYDAVRTTASQPFHDEDADPYLTPSEIAWTVNDAQTPEPVAVRLSIRDCAAVAIRPEKSRGPFWAINEPPEPVMDGDDLVDFLIEPESLDALAPGMHEDTLRFVVDAKAVVLRLHITIADPHAAPGSAADSTSDRPKSARAGGPSRRHRRVFALLTIGASLLVALALAILDVGGTAQSTDARPRSLFVAHCGRCHKLDDAGTQPAEEFATRAGFARNIGPDLDRLAPPSGLTLDAIEHGRNRGVGRMPAHLLRGVTARMVARYVARATAPPPPPPSPRVTAHTHRRGSLQLLVLDHAPDGRLSFVAARAVAVAGILTIQSHNESDTPHDLVLSGPGMHREMPVTVAGEGADLTVRLRPGRYVYYCSIPGHREAGERGTLVVHS